MANRLLGFTGSILHIWERESKDMSRSETRTLKTPLMDDECYVCPGARYAPVSFTVPHSYKDTQIIQVVASHHSLPRTSK